MFSLRRSVFRSLKPGSVYVPPAVLQQQRARAFQTLSVFSTTSPHASLRRAESAERPTSIIRSQQKRWQSDAPGWQAHSETPADPSPAANHRGADGSPLPPSKTVYVGNISYGIRAEDLSREFAEFGEIIHTKIIYDPRGLSKGFGYVEFSDETAAGRAIEKMNGLTVDGRRITVQYVVKRDGGVNKEPNPPSRTLFIGNLSFDITDKDLNELFQDIKNCTDVRVAIDRRTGQPRGFAHADFVDVGSAENAKAILEDKELYGRRLKLDYSTGVAKGERSFMR